MDMKFVCMFIFPPDLYTIFGCSLSLSSHNKCKMQLMQDKEKQEIFLTDI